MNARVLAAALFLTNQALAQAPSPPRAMPGGPSPVAKAMMDGMSKMNQDMGGAPMTGDPDHDFVAMMIPHHEGAVEMAKVELRYGKDPAMRKLAQAIVAAQDKEIVQMHRWQAEHPAR